ncbi:MAG: hypothetical protein U9R08_05935, partial [Nanoarchaeota archaeon]|nr:hypothetical protein [Nanoarchaeota archaeon]
KTTTFLILNIINFNMFVKLMDIFGTKTRALEMYAVFKDVKPVARLGFYPDEFEAVAQFCEKNGLTLQWSIFKVILTDKYKGYSDRGEKVSINDPNEGMRFGYISKDPKKAAQAKYFEEVGDRYNLGLTLGYPLCCIEFFEKNYPERSQLDNDYTEPSFHNSHGNFPFVNNILMRKRDTTLLFHFPCSFQCPESAKMGMKHLELLKEADSELAIKYEQRLKNWFEYSDKDIEFS